MGPTSYRTIRKGASLRCGFVAVRQHGVLPLRPLRRKLPAALSWAGSPGRVELPLSAITTAAGFAYGSGGWHPHVETLRWLAEAKGTDPAQSPLGRLYSAFQPRTVREAVFDDLPDPVAGLSEVPLVRGQLRELWNPRGPRSLGASGALDRPGLYWGPASTEDLAAEIDRTSRVHESLAATGFRDEGPGKEAISGYLLVRGEDYRLVLHQGHHRLASLTALGHASVPVHLTYKVPPIVREDDLTRWTDSRSPRYGPSSARMLFSRLFESTGFEKAARLGILPDASGSPHHRDDP